MPKFARSLVFVALFFWGLELLGQSEPWRYWLRASGPKHSAELSAEQRGLLQSGDVLLRRGFGALSESIVDYLAEAYPLSHCGLVLEDDLGGLWVLHSIQEGAVDGTAMQSMEVYLRESQRGSLLALRPRGADLARALMREMLRLHDKRLPFDRFFDHRDSSALYCVEFFDLALRNLGQPRGLDSERLVGSKRVLGLSGFWEREDLFYVLFNQHRP